MDYVAWLFGLVCGVGLILAALGIRRLVWARLATPIDAGTLVRPVSALQRACEVQRPDGSAYVPNMDAASIASATKAVILALRQERHSNRGGFEALFRR